MVNEALKNSQLCTLIGALITTNDHYAEQLNEDSPFGKWLRSGLDDEDVAPEEIPTFDDVRSMIEGYDKARRDEEEYGDPYDIGR